MSLRSTTALFVFLVLCGAFGWHVAASADMGPVPEHARAAATPAAVAQADGATPALVSEAPTAETAPSPTLTPFIVTPMPTPESVLAAATQVLATATWIAEHGTPTPTPPNMVTATYTPRPYVVVNTPTPANAATATYEALVAQAVAVTTGTPTPLPTGFVTATPPPTYAPPAAPRVWPTATRLLIPLDDPSLLAAQVYMTPTPAPTPNVLPEVLIGKIAFFSDRLGSTRVFVMDPDGSNVALLTDSWAYEAAAAQESRSPDGRYLVYQQNGGGGLDLFLRHLAEHLADVNLTRIGRGVTYDPAWAPDSYRIAFTSNQEGNDEIYLVTRDGGVQRLTQNAWEWDKHPSFSPDGTQIAYWSSVGEGRKQIWVMAADGSGHRNVSNSPHNDWDPIWIKGLW